MKWSEYFRIDRNGVDTFRINGTGQAGNQGQQAFLQGFLFVVYTDIEEYVTDYRQRKQDRTPIQPHEFYMKTLPGS